MAKIDSHEIKKVAELARLELSDDEVQDYAQSIQEILDYVDQLKSVSVDGIEPMIHGVSGGLILREDEVVPFSENQEGKPRILDSAPDVVDDGFKVPRVVG